MFRCRGPGIAVLTVLLVGGTVADARPVHRKALGDHFGPFLVRKLNDCRTCHLPEAADTSRDPLAEDKPHNPFGARLKAVKDELRLAGKKTDIPARLEAIAEEDSDGDGVANLAELLTGHFPGEPTDKPPADELSKVPETLAALRKAQASYQWRPFDAVIRPAEPLVKNDAWIGNPIDAFIAADHEVRGLKPRPEASKQVLLRRLYLDLIGLPPTREELHAFLADQSPDSYEKVVDRLLASPQHGERWGRHWMDVWRYSDWAGYGNEVRESQRHIWRWRDWIVTSVNEDKGYDRMIQEMLAGDELAPTDPDTLRATGFLARNWYKFNRHIWLQNTIEHTAKAFLGVSINCARCHDHFFDPISQQEYYEFRAFFETHNIRTDRMPGQANLDLDGLPRAYDAELSPPTPFFIRGEEHRPDKLRTITPAVPSILGGKKVEIQPVNLPALASAPDKRDFVIAETVTASAQSIPAAQRNLARTRVEDAARAVMSSLDEPLKATGKIMLTRPASGLAVAELDAQLAVARHEALLTVLKVEQLEDAGKKDTDDWKQAATSAHLAQRKQAVLEAQRGLLVTKQSQLAASKNRADADKKVADAEKALTAAEANAQMPPSTAYTKRTLPSYPASSSGRRLALARWITDRQNPLAARVAMNHLWLRHFGRPLVPSTFDFGRNGQQPSHPALLDWLAAEFMDQHWNMKTMHRLIVTSRTYRMDSSPDPHNAGIDSDNRYLWRMNPHRMEAELVRDSVLHAAGSLDTTLGGPEIDQNQGLNVRRRSVYFRHAHEKQMEFLKLFDAASVTECYQRPESIVPQQALALANSSLVLAQSRRLARHLSKDMGNDAGAFVTAAFEQVLSRLPTEAERGECVQFLSEQTARLAEPKKLTAFPAAVPGSVAPAADPRMRARESLLHVLFNHHDFVTIR